MLCFSFFQTYSLCRKVYFWQAAAGASSEPCGHSHALHMDTGLLAVGLRRVQARWAQTTACSFGFAPEHRLTPSLTAWATVRGLVELLEAQHPPRVPSLAQCPLLGHSYSPPTQDMGLHSASLTWHSSPCGGLSVQAWTPGSWDCLIGPGSVASPSAVPWPWGTRPGLGRAGAALAHQWPMTPQPHRRDPLPWPGHQGVSKPPPAPPLAAAPSGTLPAHPTPELSTGPWRFASSAGLP